MTTIVDYHAERSWHFLDLVDDEVERGDIEEASNKLWRAASDAIKAVAERRGWPYGSHNALADTVMRLIDDEGAPPLLYTYYTSASSFHSRFYGWPPNSDEIRHGKGQMAEFIRLLESL